MKSYMIEDIGQRYISGKWCRDGVGEERFGEGDVKEGDVGLRVFFRGRCWIGWCWKWIYCRGDVVEGDACQGDVKKGNIGRRCWRGWPW
jgi:hypothetical protein